MEAVYLFKSMINWYVSAFQSSILFSACAIYKPSKKGFYILKKLNYYDVDKLGSFRLYDLFQHFKISYWLTRFN